MTVGFRVTWHSYDNDVIGNRKKHNNKLKCIKFNGRISVTNNLRSGDHLLIDGRQWVQSAVVKKVIGRHYDDCRPTMGRHSAKFERLILQNKSSDGAAMNAKRKINSKTIKNVGI